MLKVSETLEDQQIIKFKVFSKILLLVFQPNKPCSEDDLWNSALDFYSKGEWNQIRADFGVAFTKAGESMTIETKAQIGQIFLNYVRDYGQDVKDEKDKAMKCLYFALTNALIFYGIVTVREIPSNIGCNSEYFVNRFEYCQQFEEFANGILEDAKRNIESEDPNWTPQ